MAVTRVDEIHDDRSMYVSEDGIRRYTRTFRVFTNDPTTTQLEVQVTSGLPRLFDAYLVDTVYDYGSTVRKIDCDQDQDTPTVWKVKVEYSSEYRPVMGVGADITNLLTGSPAPPGGGGNGINHATGTSPQRGDASEPNPLLRPPQISFSSQKTTRVLRTDALGAATVNVNGVILTLGADVVNTAGDPFDPPIEVQNTDRIITITKNQAVFDRGQAEDFQEAINSATFLGYAEDTVKCESIDAASQLEGGTWFWAVTYTFTVRRAGWLIKVLDAGYQRLTNTGLKAILDENGMQVTAPHMLDGLGNAQARPFVPVYITFHGYIHQDFNDLHIFS